jgi:serine protease Do
MAMMLRRFSYFAAVLFLLFACSLQPSSTGAAVSPKAKRDHRGDPVQERAQVPFENCVRNVFSAKKKAIVRVVSVLRQEHGTTDDQMAKQIISGTGFFVSDRAHVVTAASIAKNVQTIWVDYMGTSYAAECIGMDLHTNVAVLRLLHPPSEFGIVNLAEENQQKLCEIGSFAVFIGCRLGTDPSPELGTIAGKNICCGDNTFLTTYLRTNFIFCGGESGAPVFELDGELAGMMVASLPDMASSFMLPKRALAKVFGEIMANGFVKHPKIGIDVRAEYKLGVGQEMVISKVTAGSEADRAGLHVGDTLKKAGIFDVRYKEDLCNALFFCCRGGKLDITVIRDGKELPFAVKNEYLSE